MPQVRRASLNWPSTRSFSNPTHQGARTWVLSRKNVAPRCPSTNTASASRPIVIRSKPWACWKASGLPGLFFLSAADIGFICILFCLRPVRTLSTPCFVSPTSRKGFIYVVLFLWFARGPCFRCVLLCVWNKGRGLIGGRGGGIEVGISGRRRGFRVMRKWSNAAF